ncbi:hypothetical protein, partial [Escherichia coli]|uniref:hypothetical protein n=1 Tax=Escherichia coli TaxID=562 RepID=UPI001BC8B76D
MPDATLARLILPHKPDSTAKTSSPNCPLPYFPLTRNLTLTPSKTIFLLTKFTVKIFKKKAKKKKKIFLKKKKKKK